jgi:hypothetical protein
MGYDTGLDVTRLLPVARRLLELIGHAANCRLGHRICATTLSVGNGFRKVRFDPF